jgi:hypothetical protein
VRRFTLLSAAILSLATFCRADVFIRYKSSGESSRALTATGGSLAYEARVSLNGSRGQLSVFSFSMDMKEVWKKLLKLFPALRIMQAGDNMTIAILDSDSVVLRLLLLHLPDSDNSIVIKLEQTKDEYKASLKPPVKHPLTDIPVFPDSTPAIFIHNHDTNMRIASSHTKSPAEAVNAFYEAQLAQSGWKRLWDGQTSLHGYVKGDESCFLLVSPAGTNSLNSITLVLKKQTWK